VVGWDTFAREEYFIGEYPSEARAMAAAEKHAQEVACYQDESLRNGVWVVPAGGGRPVYPRAVTVAVGERGVCCTWPDGKREAVGWEDLSAVEVVTTAAGPFVGGACWVLRGSRGSCRVPHEADGRNALLERLQQLPGFDDSAVTSAMSSTASACFSCWQRGQA
jgi:hypothetical protein